MISQACPNQEIQLKQTLPQNKSKIQQQQFQTKINTLKQQPSKCSHILFSILSILLILFSISSSIIIYITIQQFNTISGSSLSKISMYMLIGSIIISFLAIIAIILSWKKITWYLHFYEFVCLVILAVFIVIAIGIVMMDINSLQKQAITNTTNNNNTSNLLNSCYSPTNYFQLKMLDISNQASNLLCSSTCPCPKYTQVQQCPTWVSTPYDIIMQQMQQQLYCSGWCISNNDHSNKFMFSNLVNKDVSGPCYDQWISWVAQKYKLLIGCMVTIVVILFGNILVVNWRILQISSIQNQQQQN